MKNQPAFSIGKDKRRMFADQIKNTPSPNLYNTFSNTKSKSISAIITTAQR